MASIKILVPLMMLIASMGIHCATTNGNGNGNWGNGQGWSSEDSCSIPCTDSAGNDIDYTVCANVGCGDLTLSGGYCNNGGIATNTDGGFPVECCRLCRVARSGCFCGMDSNNVLNAVAGTVCRPASTSCTAPTGANAGAVCVDGTTCCVGSVGNGDNGNGGGNGNGNSWK